MSDVLLLSGLLIRAESYSALQSWNQRQTLKSSFHLRPIALFSDTVRNELKSTKFGRLLQNKGLCDSW